MKAPTVRRECIHGDRPCPWIRCKHHMLWGLLELTESGQIISLKRRTQKLSDAEVLELLFSLKETCVLDVADRGSVTLDDIGQIWEMTRERVRQIIECKSDKDKIGAIQRLRHPVRRHFLEDFAHYRGPEGVPHAPLQL